MSETTTIDSDSMSAVTDYLSAEIQSLVTEENQDFLRIHARKISDTFSRFHWRLRRLPPASLMRLYGEMLFELARCEIEMGHYRDATVLDICLGLRLQRRLQRFFHPRPLETEPCQPSTIPDTLRKPKFRPTRRVA